MIIENSDITTWLMRLLGLTAVMMCAWLVPAVRAEAMANPEPWYQNRTLRLAAALFIHGTGAILLFASPIFYPIGSGATGPLYVLWAALGLWLIAKLLIISVVGRLYIALIVLGLWTGGRLLWEFYQTAGGVG
jgi:hypothetical protein